MNTSSKTKSDNDTELTKFAEKLSYEELIKLKNLADAKIKEQKSDKIREMRKRFKEQCLAADLDYYEVIGISKPSRNTSETKPQTKKIPKYINPEDPTQTYGGKGPKPEWFLGRTEGKTKEELVSILAIIENPEYSKIS